MTIPEVVSTRIEKLDGYLSALRQIGDVTLDEFRRNPEKHFSVERCLQLAIETVLDIGDHVIAAYSLGEPKDYEDIITILAQSKVLPPDYAGRLRGLGKFRNILVHEYINLDLDKVYGYIKHADDLKEFVRYIVQYIEKR